MEKKIIFTVTTDPNYDQRMQRICSALANNGYEVELIGRVLPHSVELSKQNFKQKRLKLIFNKSFFFYAEYNIRIFFYLLFNSFDILCSIDLDSILPGFIVSKLKGKPFVHDAHELFTEMPELNENIIAKSVWTKIEQVIFPKLRFAMTESEGYQEVYHKNYPTTQFKVIRNVPFYYNTSIKDKSENYIFYQGALNVGRGLEQVIQVLPQIDEQYSFWLAGEGDVSQSLRQLVKEMKLEHRVQFLGMVKPKDLKQLTLNATIGLNLLDPENEHYQLSFPNKLFDYIMAELPQISMNFPYYQQIIGDETIGVLIDDWAIETVAGAINELLTNEILYNQSVEGCKVLKEQNNWDKEKEKLIDFYNAIA